MRAVKAIGKGIALRVYETKSAGEDVGPEGQPVHQIRRCFNDNRLPRLPRKEKAELTAVEAKVRSRAENHDRRIPFPDRAGEMIGHIEVAVAVQSHARRIIKPRFAP